MKKFSSFSIHGKKNPTISAYSKQIYTNLNFISNRILNDLKV